MTFIDTQPVQLGLYLAVATVVALLAWRVTGANAWTLVALSVALVVLAGLKAAGVQVAITDAGRELSRQEGWYQSRRVVQALAVCGFGALALLPLLGERVPLLGRSPYRLTISACCLFCAYILARTVSLHYVDSVLYRTDWHAVTINSLVEMALVLAIGAAAAVDGLRARTTARAG
jgi:hypothetical protein